MVGDPEAVVDSDGLFPAERRKLMLEQYEDLRTIAVIALRRQVRESQAGIAAAGDRAVRAQHRAELRDATRKLDNWLGVGTLTAEDMCSECPTPNTRHGWVSPPTDGPCRAWPQWAARVAEARELLLRAVASGGRSVALPPEPEPVAVIASGLPIGEIIDQLTDVRRRYPESVVRRGRANRWEIWPAVGPVSTPDPAAAG